MFYGLIVNSSLLNTIYNVIIQLNITNADEKKSLYIYIVWNVFILFMINIYGTFLNFRLFN